MSKVDWKYAIATVARLYGLSLVGEVLRAGAFDGYRVRVRFDDDPPRSFRVVNIKHDDYRAIDVEVLCDYIGGHFDRLILEHEAEKRREPRWSPYPWSPCA